MDISKQQQAAINEEVSAAQAKELEDHISDYQRGVARVKIERILERRKANELNLLEC